MRACRRILLVDDEPELSKALGRVLENAGYVVSFAGSAHEAIQRGKPGEQDLIITDLKMKNGGGLDLLRHMRTIPFVPVLVLTGFTEIPESKEALGLGATGLLSKSIRNAELLEIVGEAVDHAPQRKIDRFKRIRIDDFISGSAIKYDVFIRLRREKHVLIAHSGEDLSRERILAFKAKDVTHLYLKEADFLDYLGMNLALWDALKKSNISVEKKAVFLRHTFDVVFEQAFVEGLNRQLFKESCSLLKEITEFVTGDDIFFMMLEKIKESSDALYAHSMAVTIYSLMLAQRLEWRSTPTLYKLGLGAMLHDLGKRELGPEILGKHRSLLTPSEEQALDSHPQRGVEGLKHIRWLHDDILATVAQHELKILTHANSAAAKRVHPFARLVNIANVFCNLTLTAPETVLLMARDALACMSRPENNHFDEKMFSAFKCLFHVTGSE